MQPTAPLIYSLASTNPIQQFTIPQQLVLHSETIKRNINNPLFKKETCFSIQDTTPQDVLHLISCLKNIDIITKNNAAHSVSSKRRTFAQQTLKKYTSCLALDELITLAQNANYLCIDHHYFKKSIAYALATKIISTPSDAREIFNATPESLHNNLMKACNKQASIDAILMQSYSELLEPTCSPPLLHPQYFQRLFIQIDDVLGKDTKYKPRYYNTQTETAIIALSRSGSLYRILNLQITKKNATEPIIIDTKTIPICTITAIKANEDESLFICEYDDSSVPKKSFVINLNNPDSPLITRYHHYAFKSDDANMIYVSSDHSLGIFNITTNTYNPITYFPLDIVQDMQLNNNQSWIVLRAYNTIHIGKKAKDESFDFTEINTQFFKKNCTADFDYIRSICIHPSKDTLFVLLGHHINNHAICCMVDLNSYKTTVLKLNDKIKDVYSNHISFLNDDILYIDSATSHHFINIKTGHSWTKKKDTFQILFTADKSHSLELHSTYSNGRDYEKLKMIPLYNEKISQGIASLNKGEFPLLLLDILHHKSNTLVALNDDEYQEYIQLKQSPLGEIIDSIYTITQKDRFSRFCGLLRQHSPSKKNLKGWSAAIACGIIGLALYYGIDYYDINKRLDTNDKRNFIKGLFALILFLAKI